MKTLKKVVNMVVGEEPFITYRHLRVRHLNRVFPVVTFRFELYRNSNKLRFSFAVCSKKDQFSRDTGRVIANSRMNNGEFFYIDFDPKDDFIKAAIAHLKGLENANPLAFINPKNCSENAAIARCLEAVDILGTYHSLVANTDE